MKDTVYITMNRSGAVSMRKSKPKLNSGQVAVRINLAVPDTFFDRFIPEVNIEVPNTALIHPRIEAEVEIEPEVLRDVLSLVMDPWPEVDEIEQWADEERDEACTWASARHLRASDHDDVEIPPKPEVIRRWEEAREESQEVG
jgi:hypothetical protein